jgi:hypothetical protein
MSLIRGFPQSNGARVESVMTKTGPASYTQVSVATPPTGGQTVEAKEFGLKYIEFLESSLSDDGQYQVFATPKVADAKGVSSWTLMWVTASGGAEVAAETDLSGRTVRLRAIGLI